MYRTRGSPRQQDTHTRPPPPRLHSPLSLSPKFTSFLLSTLPHASASRTHPCFCFFSFPYIFFPASGFSFILPSLLLSSYKCPSSRSSPSLRLLLLPPLTPASRLSFLLLLVSSPAFLSPLIRFFSCFSSHSLYQCFFHGISC